MTHLTYRLPLYNGWRRVVWHLGHRWMGNRVLGWFAVWVEYEMEGPHALKRIEEQLEAAQNALREIAGVPCVLEVRLIGVPLRHVPLHPEGECVLCDAHRAREASNQESQP